MSESKYLSCCNATFILDNFILQITGETLVLRSTWRLSEKITYQRQVRKYLQIWGPCEPHENLSHPNKSGFTVLRNGQKLIYIIIQCGLKMSNSSKQLYSFNFASQTFLYQASFKWCTFYIYTDINSIQVTKIW